jgi:hypothetical protein
MIALHARQTLTVYLQHLQIIITWTLNNQRSDSQKGTGMAILNVIGQLGPLVGTSIFPEKDGPWYVRGMSMCAGFMLCVGFLAVILRWWLGRENRKAKGYTGGGEYAGVPLDEGEAVKGRREEFEFML